LISARRVYHADNGQSEDAFPSLSGDEDHDLAWLIFMLLSEEPAAVGPFFR
jgi:hypothetical protein